MFVMSLEIENLNYQDDEKYISIDQKSYDHESEFDRYASIGLSIER